MLAQLGAGAAAHDIGNLWALCRECHRTKTAEETAARSAFEAERRQHNREPEPARSILFEQARRRYLAALGIDAATLERVAGRKGGGAG